MAGTGSGLHDETQKTDSAMLGQSEFDFAARPEMLFGRAGSAGIAMTLPGMIDWSPKASHR